MFGFSSLGQVPFASLPREGVPAQATLTGQGLLSFLSSPSATGKSNVTLLDQYLVGSTGILFNASRYDITGIELAGSTGSLATKAKASLVLSGQELESYINSLYIILGYRITGIALTSAIQSLTTTGAANTNVISQELITAINNVRATGDAVIRTTSQTIRAYEASLATKGRANVTLDGIPAIINIQNLLVWGLIPDNQNPFWTPIDDSQLDTWTLVADSQTTTWASIPKPTNIWTDINDSESDDWTDVIH
jgi:hypothetical protein